MKKSLEVLRILKEVLPQNSAEESPLAEGEPLDAAAPEPLPKWDDTQVSEGAEEGFVRTRPNGTGAQVAR